MEISIKTNADGVPDSTEETLSSELGELITTIASHLRHGSFQKLSSMGISFTQARVLKTLSRATSPMRMSDIAREIEVVPRSATTLVEALEERALVRREVDHTDRRSVEIYFRELQTRSGLNGISIWRMPKSESASITAFTTAGVEPILPDSPIPFTPSSLRSDSVS